MYNRMNRMEPEKDTFVDAEDLPLKESPPGTNLGDLLRRSPLFGPLRECIRFGVNDIVHQTRKVTSNRRISAEERVQHSVVALWLRENGYGLAYTAVKAQMVQAFVDPLELNKYVKTSQPGKSPIETLFDGLLVDAATLADVTPKPSTATPLVKLVRQQAWSDAERVARRQQLREEMRQSLVVHARAENQRFKRMREMAQAIEKERAEDEQDDDDEDGGEEEDEEGEAEEQSIASAKSNDESEASVKDEDSTPSSGTLSDHDAKNSEGVVDDDDDDGEKTPKQFRSSIGDLRTDFIVAKLDQSSQPRQLSQPVGSETSNSHLPSIFTPSLRVNLRTSLMTSSTARKGDAGAAQVSNIDKDENTNDEDKSTARKLSALMGDESSSSDDDRKKESAAKNNERGKPVEMKKGEQKDEKRNRKAGNAAVEVDVFSEVESVDELDILDSAELLSSGASSLSF